MKRITKIIITVALLCTLTIAFGILAGAEEVSTDAIEAASVAAESEENFFTELFLEIKSYATEIFCALTFLGSVILAFAYKKGLLPFVEKALLSIGNSVTRINERTEHNEENTEKFSKEMRERLECTEEVITALEEKIEIMTQSLNDVKDGELLKNRENRNLAILMSAQIDMLYDIFMSSALPQYQKDAVGERVAVMKEALRGNASE